MGESLSKRGLEECTVCAVLGAFINAFNYSVKIIRPSHLGAPFHAPAPRLNSLTNRILVARREWSLQSLQQGEDRSNRRDGYGTCQRC